MKAFAEYSQELSEDAEAQLYVDAYKLMTERKDLIDIVSSWFGKQFNGDTYKLALKALADVIARKKKNKELRHDIYYYAQRVAGSFAGVDGRELADMYLAGVSESEAPTVTSGAVAVADSPFRVSKVAGCDCIEVDADTYMRCKFGKRPYAKWSGYVEDEGLRSFVQKHYGKSKSLLIANKDTGVATYLKR